MRKLIYILIATMTLTSCEKDNYPTAEAGPVSVKFRFGNNKASNTDGIAINTVRVIVFDHSAGFLVFNGLVEPIVVGSDDYAIAMKAGVRDFYIIANEPTDMGAIKHKSELDTATIPGTAYNTVSNIPCFLAIENVIVREKGDKAEVSVDGGTNYTDKLIAPTEPIASKISLSIRKNTAVSTDKVVIQKVTIENVATSASWIEATYTGEYTTVTPAITEVELSENTNDLSSTINYESVFADAIVPENRVTELSRGTNIVIEALYNGVETIYRIPLGKWANDIYTDYSIRRNVHYVVKATVNGIGEFNYKPYIEYEIAPWDDAGSGEVEIGGVVVFTANWAEGTTIDENGSIRVNYKSSVEFDFILSNPKGTTWTASLSNGLDFAFDYTNGGVSSGSTREGIINKIRIRPLREVYTNNVKTKFFITVNNGGTSTEIDINGEDEGTRFTINQNSN